MMNEKLAVLVFFTGFGPAPLPRLRAIHNIICRGKTSNKNVSKFLRTLTF